MEDRGILPPIEERDKFFYPTLENEHDPSLLDHMEEGYQLLFKHLRQGSHIYLIVDPDVDGYTSSSLFYLYLTEHLRSYGDFTIDYHVPDGKSHGLESVFGDLKESKKYDLIVCPDSSSNDYEYHEALAALGYEILVLDHHEAERYSEHAVVINNQLSERYPNKALSGVGVVYKFFEYCEQKEGLPSYSREYLDLVALGEISDVMNMTTLENRWIVEQGLANIKNQFFLSLVLHQSFSLKLDERPLNQIGIAFYITPLINALIRVGNPVEKENLFVAFINPNLEVPSTKRGEKDQMETISTQVARNCTNAKSRQQRERTKAAELLDIQILENDLDNNKILILNADDLNVTNNLTGLCAMEVASKYKKPVLLGRITPDGKELKGSIRNKDGSPLKDLKKFLTDSGLMSYVEGHSSAAGFGIQVSKLDKLLDYANKELADVDFSEGSYEVDFLLDGNEIAEASSIIYGLADGEKYWGQGNPEALIGIRGIHLNGRQIQIIGSNYDTIKIVIDGVVLMKFKAKNYIEQFARYQNNEADITLTIVGKPNINSWGGRTTPQIFIEDFEIKEINNIMEDF